MSKQNYSRAIGKGGISSCLVFNSRQATASGSGRCDQHHMCSISSLSFLLNVNPTRASRASFSTYPFAYCSECHQRESYYTYYSNSLDWSSVCVCVRPSTRAPIQLNFHEMACEWLSQQQQLPNRLVVGDSHIDRIGRWKIIFGERVYHNRVLTKSFRKYANACNLGCACVECFRECVKHLNEANK